VTGWHQAWTEALDHMEADVGSAEALLAEDHRMRDHPVRSAWRPPDGLGPLPLELRTRADEVLLRQQAVAERLQRLMAGTARQAAVIGRIDDGQPAPRPSFVDCAM
jgi:hypothetical protein